MLSLHTLSIQSSRNNVQSLYLVPVVRHLCNISPFKTFCNTWHGMAWSTLVKIPTLCHQSKHSTGTIWFQYLNKCLHGRLISMKPSCSSPRWRSLSPEIFPWPGESWKNLATKKGNFFFFLEMNSARKSIKIFKLIWPKLFQTERTQILRAFANSF